MRRPDTRFALCRGHASLEFCTALPLRFGAAPRRTASTPRAAAVFLDKDGTRIEDLPYNVAPECLRFTAGVLAALRLFDVWALPIVIVSKQPGLANGRFTQGELRCSPRC